MADQLLDRCAVAAIGVRDVARLAPAWGAERFGAALAGVESAWLRYPAWASDALERLKLRG